MLDAAKGMLYLSSRTPPVIHRDLKSANLLVTKDYTVKVLQDLPLLEAPWALLPPHGWPQGCSCGGTCGRTGSWHAATLQHPAHHASAAASSHCPAAHQVCDFNLANILEDSGVHSSVHATNPRCSGRGPLCALMDLGVDGWGWGAPLQRLAALTGILHNSQRGVSVGSLLQVACAGDPAGPARPDPERRVQLWGGAVGGADLPDALCGRQPVAGAPRLGSQVLAGRAASPCSR